MKLGEAMYKAQQEEAQAAGAEGAADAADMGAESKPEDDTVVDADFEEVDPDQDKKNG